MYLGDNITIKDGTYNVVWMIAGFDMEHNQTAADGTVYDNGYGICMIPKTYITSASWNSNSNSNGITGAYKSSTMHTSTLPTIVTKLKNVLGSHIVNRNVLLSSSVDSSSHSNAYTWTTSYATLMSVGQLTGTFAANRNKYDDGEANYKLPLFNYEDYNINNTFWFRGIWGFNFDFRAYCTDIEGNIGCNPIGYTMPVVRPMIYLR